MHADTSAARREGRDTNGGRGAVNTAHGTAKASGEKAR